MQEQETEEMSTRLPRSYCPLRHEDCYGETCMLYVIVNNGVRLGCAFTVMAKQLDKMEYTLRKRDMQS
jgi:hypothetical protein